MSRLYRRHKPPRFAIPGDRVAKGIVLRRDGGYLLVVLPASRRIRLQALRIRLDNYVELATAVEIAQLFRDCARGAVPAVGECYGLEVLVDDSIDTQPDVYMEGGDHGHACPYGPPAIRAIKCGGSARPIQRVD